MQQKKQINENDIEFGRLKLDYNIVKIDKLNNHSIDISHIKRIRKENDSQNLGILIGTLFSWNQLDKEI